MGTTGPSINDAYQSGDSITGTRDAGQERINQKMGIFSSITAATALLGNTAGTFFVVGTNLTIYTADGTSITK